MTFSAFSGRKVSTEMREELSEQSPRKMPEGESLPALIYWDSEYLGVVNYLLEKGIEKLPGESWPDRAGNFIKEAGKRIKDSVALEMGPVSVELDKLLAKKEAPQNYVDREKLEFYREKLEPMDIWDFIENIDSLKDDTLVLLYCEGLEEILLISTALPDVEPSIGLKRGACYYNTRERFSHDFLRWKCIPNYLTAHYYTPDRELQGRITCYIRREEPLSSMILSPAMVLGLVYATPRVACASYALDQPDPLKSATKGILAIAIWGLEPGPKCPWWNQAISSLPSAQRVSSERLGRIFSEIMNPERPPSKPPYFVAATRELARFIHPY